MGMPIKHIRPTHVGRHPEVFAQAIAFTKAGGYIDITTSGGNYMGSAADAFVMAWKKVRRSIVLRSLLTATARCLVSIRTAK